MVDKKSVVWASGVLLLGLFVIGAFQNCTRVKTESPPPNTQLGNANGEGYAGKTFTKYATCNGNPVAPFAKIRISQDLSEAQLIRDNCVDILNPLMISMRDLTFASKAKTSVVFYLGDSFYPDEAGSITFGKFLFSVPGTANLTLPASVTRIRVTVVGAGGAGGAPGAYTRNPDTWGGGGGGGGGGGRSISTLNVASAMHSLVVGAGGASALFDPALFGSNNHGGQGAISSFDGNVVAAEGIAAAFGGNSQQSSDGGGGLFGSGGLSLAGQIQNRGSDGTRGADASTVQGNQSLFHGAGGVGGAGFVVDGVVCGSGGSAVDPSSLAPSAKGGDGCILIEWGGGI